MTQTNDDQYPIDIIVDAINRLREDADQDIRFGDSIEFLKEKEYLFKDPGLEIIGDEQARQFDAVVNQSLSTSDRHEKEKHKYDLNKKAAAYLSSLQSSRTVKDPDSTELNYHLSKINHAEEVKKLKDKIEQYEANLKTDDEKRSKIDEALTNLKSLSPKLDSHAVVLEKELSDKVSANIENLETKAKETLKSLDNLLSPVEGKAVKVGLERIERAVSDQQDSLFWTQVAFGVGIVLIVLITLLWPTEFGTNNYAEEVNLEVFLNVLPRLGLTLILLPFFVQQYSTASKSHSDYREFQAKIDTTRALGDFQIFALEEEKQIYYYLLQHPIRQIKTKETSNTNELNKILELANKSKDLTK